MKFNLTAIFDEVENTTEQEVDEDILCLIIASNPKQALSAIGKIISLNLDSTNLFCPSTKDETEQIEREKVYFKLLNLLLQNGIFEEFKKDSTATDQILGQCLKTSDPNILKNKLLFLSARKIINFAEPQKIKIFNDNNKLSFLPKIGLDLKFDDHKKEYEKYISTNLGLEFKFTSTVQAHNRLLEAFKFLNYFPGMPESFKNMPGHKVAFYLTNSEDAYNTKEIKNLFARVKEKYPKIFQKTAIYEGRPHTIKEFFAMKKHYALLLFFTEDEIRRQIEYLPDTDLSQTFKACLLSYYILVPKDKGAKFAEIIARKYAKYFSTEDIISALIEKNQYDLLQSYVDKTRPKFTHLIQIFSKLDITDALANIIKKITISHMKVLDSNFNEENPYFHLLDKVGVDFLKGIITLVQCGTAPKDAIDLAAGNFDLSQMRLLKILQDEEPILQYSTETVLGLNYSPPVKLSPTRKKKTKDVDFKLMRDLLIKISDPEILLSSCKTYITSIGQDPADPLMLERIMITTCINHKDTTLLRHLYDQQIIDINGMQLYYSDETKSEMVQRTITKHLVLTRQDQILDWLYDFMHSNYCTPDPAKLKKFIVFFANRVLPESRIDSLNSLSQMTGNFRQLNYKLALELIANEKFEALRTAITEFGLCIDLPKYEYGVQDNETILLNCIQARNYKAIENILRLGADPDFRWPDGSTYLIYATKLKYNQAFDLLIKYNASPELRDIHSFSCFEYSVIHLNTHAFRYCMTNHKNFIDDYFTADYILNLLQFHCSDFAKQGSPAVEILKLLIEHKIITPELGHSFSDSMKLKSQGTTIEPNTLNLLERAFCDDRPVTALTELLYNNAFDREEILQQICKYLLTKDAIAPQSSDFAFNTNFGHNVFGTFIAAHHLGYDLILSRLDYTNHKFIAYSTCAYLWDLKKEVRTDIHSLYKFCELYDLFLISYLFKNGRVDNDFFKKLYSHPEIQLFKKFIKILDDYTDDLSNASDDGDEESFDDLETPKPLQSLDTQNIEHTLKLCEQAFHGTNPILDFTTLMLDKKIDLAYLYEYLFAKDGILSESGNFAHNIFGTFISAHDYEYSCILDYLDMENHKFITRATAAFIIDKYNELLEDITRLTQLCDKYDNFLVKYLSIKTERDVNFSQELFSDPALEEFQGLLYFIFPAEGVSQDHEVTTIGTLEQAKDHGFIFV